MFCAYLPFVTLFFPLAITPPIVVLIKGASSTTIPSDISWILVVTAAGYLKNTRQKETWLTNSLPLSLKVSTSWAASLLVSPAAQEDVVSPDHWERQQLVQVSAGDPRLHRGKTLNVPQYELSSCQPLLVGLTVAPEGLHPPGQLRVLGEVFRNVGVISAPPLRHPYKTKTLPVEWKYSENHHTWRNASWVSLNLVYKPSYNRQHQAKQFASWLLCPSNSQLKLPGSLLKDPTDPKQLTLKWTGKRVSRWKVNCRTQQWKVTRRTR